MPSSRHVIVTSGSNIKLANVTAWSNRHQANKTNQPSTS